MALIDMVEPYARKLSDSEYRNMRNRMIDIIQQEDERRYLNHGYQ